jgi:hypothetical protein
MRMTAHIGNIIFIIISLSISLKFLISVLQIRFTSKSLAIYSCNTKHDSAEYLTAIPFILTHSSAKEVLCRAQK